MARIAPPELASSSSSEEVGAIVNSGEALGCAHATHSLSLLSLRDTILSVTGIVLVASERTDPPE